MNRIDRSRSCYGEMERRSERAARDSYDFHFLCFCLFELISLNDRERPDTGRELNGKANIVSDLPLLSDCCSWTAMFTSGGELSECQDSGRL